MFMFESNLPQRHWSIQYFLCPHPCASQGRQGRQGRQDATGCQWPLRPMDVMAMLHNTTSPEASAVARLATHTFTGEKWGVNSG